MTAARSLTSGVSGMLNNQLSMDVIANNLANVNTPGFKGSRVSFESSLVQSLFNGAAPGVNVGGQNPRQVGLGVNTASIDIDMSQGALETTGRELDLAIQGEGFFELSDGTRPFYTRVGNLGIDADSTLIHLGTGYRLIGNTYNLDVNPDGTQSIASIGVPLSVPLGEAFPPKRTEEIEFQGNLSSLTNAMRGNSLQSVYQLTDNLTGAAATEDTAFTELETFKNTTGGPDDTVTMYMYGTKANGEAYGASFEIHPWRTPTGADPRGSVGELISAMNGGMVHGNERFGTVRLENGNLIVEAVGTGEGFSLFLGEGDAVSSPIGQTRDLNVAAGGTGLDGSVIGFDGTTNVSPAAGVYTLSTANDDHPGLLNPTFTLPAVDYSAQADRQMRISVRKNGEEIGSITFNGGDFTAAGANVFTLSGMPHVALDDTITYDFSGNLDLTNGGALPGATLTFATNVVDDYNAGNLTADLDADTIPDMFEEDSIIDTNAWQYEQSTNNNFNWYRSRLVPEVVSSSIEVFDSQGGRHTLETRFFRIGTKTEPGSDAKINSWDMMIDIPFGEGTIVDDLVTGMEFDNEGRFTGAIGTTIHNTTLDSTQHVGNPASRTIQVDWNTTGPTDPATMLMRLGDNNSYTGLTSFGSASTASSVDQDGYTNGKLDSLSVNAEGDLTALYTNGISRKLAQISLVTFRNPGGLSAAEGNLFQQTTNSGNATRRVPGNNAGFVSSGALEGANVDIAVEFSRLITAQRGFQVAARVIQTTDQILEELANLTR